MNLLEIMQKRHSIRKYTEEAIPEESLRTVVQAGLLSASSRSIRPWELIVVRDRDTLKKMSDCRVGASAAIVVIVNPGISDVWIEDCSIVMSNMHLMADSLGLGSCWIQGRLREAADGQTTEDYLRELLGYPERQGGRERDSVLSDVLEAVLSLGMPQAHPAKTELSELSMDKVHWEKY